MEFLQAYHFGGFTGTRNGRAGRGCFFCGNPLTNSEGLPYIPTMENNLLDQGEVADLLGIHPKTLGLWREKGIGPPWIRLGEKLIRYEVEGVRAWVESQREKATI